LFSTIIIDILEPELWDEEFEAYFRNTQFGNKEKACKVYEASSIYGIFMEIRIASNLDNNHGEQRIILCKFLIIHGLFEDEVCFICGMHCENVILDNDKDHYYYCEECSKKESDKKKRSKSFFAPNSRKKQRA
jgi:hypothetical protein